MQKKKKTTKKQLHEKTVRSPHGLMTKVLDCGTKVSKFKL